MTERATVHATIQAVREQLQHAPVKGGPIAPDLLGWWTPDGFFLCAPCASRLIARGCAIPHGSTASWKDEPYGVCIGHEAHPTGSNR